MAVTLEWLEKPHIIQITYQGDMTLDEIVAAWEQLEAIYQIEGENPYCALALIMPNKVFPIGFLNLSTHPAARVRRLIYAQATVGASDDFMIGMLGEQLAASHQGAKSEYFETFEAGLKYLQQRVRAYQAAIE